MQFTYATELCSSHVIARTLLCRSKPERFSIAITVYEGNVRAQNGLTTKAETAEVFVDTSVTLNYILVSLDLDRTDGYGVTEATARFEGTTGLV